MEPFKTAEKPKIIVIGIACRTSNLPEAGPKDIGRLWERFYTEGVFDQIPNKASDDVIALYCDYEGDFTKPYTCVIGCAVTSMDKVPEGMVAKTVPASRYARFEVAGEFPSSLINTWGVIWKTDLQRTYTGDFEVYGKDFAADPLKKMDVFVAIEE
ncbi:MAG: effector binding domain-containing protein [Verrucomicrobia bacterium]|nr:effector binding domain-containing protein [Verrucomicrobiota bacterium]